MATPPGARDSDPRASTRLAAGAGTESVGGAYAKYVLGILVLVYVFNFIDRQIPSILAEELRRDLGLSDAEIGFLYGTAFAVFYAIFGIPLGRVADHWDRRRLIALGLTFWSVMTAVSGLARSFFQLGAARVGVGVGEASASPAAFSMLSDYFPPERRATALGIYSSGIYIGAGLGLFVGGWVVEGWHALYPEGSPTPWGLRAWQVAFFAVGLPGILLAAWVRTLREPVRGQSEGIVAARVASPRPTRVFWEELRTLLPGFSLVELTRCGAGRVTLQRNAAALLALVLAAYGLIAWLGDPAQWIALAIGLYAAFSWAQGLALRDPPSFRLIFRTRSMVYAALGVSFVAFTSYGIGFFAAPFFIRTHGVGTGEVGTVIGLTAAIGGWLGVTLGGVVSDVLRRRSANGRLWVAAFAASFPVPLAVWMLTTPNTLLAYVLNFAISITAGMWIGPGAATVQDLVLPRMRAVASATYILLITFIGLALGPYTIGRLSVAFDDLPMGMLLSLVANGVAVLFLALAMRSLASDEESRIERARAAGETEV